MFPSHSLIPRFVCFLLMECKPPCYHSELFQGKRACQKFSIYGNGSFILPIIYMYMWFIMLFIIFKQQIDNHTRKTTQFRHYIPPTEYKIKLYSYSLLQSIFQSKRIQYLGIPTYAEILFRKRKISLAISCSKNNYIGFVKAQLT